MNFDDTKSLGRISEADLSNYESEIRGRLPEDYRNYLLQHNGALPLKLDYWMPEEDDWIETVEEMSGISDREDPRSLLYYIQGEHYIPKGWIPIAHSAYGDYTVVSIRAEDYGHIYYLFHEVYDPSATSSTDGIYHLASSFHEWIDSLEILAERD